MKSIVLSAVVASALVAAFSTVSPAQAKTNETKRSYVKEDSKGNKVQVDTKNQHKVSGDDQNRKQQDTTTRVEKGTDEHGNEVTREITTKTTHVRRATLDN